MASSRFNDPIEPMDLANMRVNGSLDVRCHNCRHRSITNVDHLPGDLSGAVLAAIMRLVQTSDAAAPATRAAENVLLFIMTMTSSFDGF